MTDITITILGCGDSAGVPRIGGDWGNCDPHNSRNRRTRPSILVQSATTTIVVDTGPDFHQQLTRENIKTVDAVLYTHAHSDHVVGMDDLRILQGRNGKRIPIYLDALTHAELHSRFKYLFEEFSSYYPAVVDVNVIDETKMNQSIRIGDIDFIVFEQDHGQGLSSLGFRFGDIGYSTDMRDLNENALNVLKGIKTWVADCADYSHGTGALHSTLPNLQRLNDTIKAPQVYLTHLKMFFDYDAMCRNLPAGYLPAYDGLKISGP
ncbi:MAG: MBL fold metallo-hydrolase [Pseudomonadota bacterium]